MSAVESCKREIEIAVPWEDVRQESDRIIESFRRQAKIPGFRPGKAPAAVVRSRYQKEIHQEVVEQLIPKFFRAEAVEKKYDIVGKPHFHELEMEDGEPMTFRAEFEVIPEFELGDYRRLQVPYNEPQVTDEQLDTELEALRQRNASFVNLDPRPLEDGDIAVLALSGDPLPDAPTINQEDTTVTLADEGTLPEFTENLRGHSPGETVDFEVTYPEDFGNSELAGKTVPFHAEIKGVRQKEVPDLDDDFAAELGDFQTLDEARSNLREQIGDAMRRQAIDAAKTKVLDQVVVAHDFPVPDSLVDNQVMRRLEGRLGSLQRQGVDLDKLDIDWRKVRDDERKPAERDVRGGLILERIAMAESLKAEPEEIDEQIKTYAARNQLAVETARKKLAEDGALDRLQVQLSRDKALSFLFDEAEKVDAEEADAEEAGTDESEKE